MNKVIVVDIDGTVANNDHRKDWVKVKPRNWNAFNKNMHKDTPHEDIIWLVNSLREMGNIIIFCTGREGVFRDTTEKWLRDHGLEYTELFMRPAKDYRSDHIVKVELLNEIRAKYGEPWLWFDDRDKVCEALRAAGVRVLQVQPGPF